MGFNIKTLLFLSGGRIYLPRIHKSIFSRYYHETPIINLYQRTTGKVIPEDFLAFLKKKHPNIDNVGHDRLQCTLQILNKFGITAEEACQDLHVFCMNPITMDNYGEILKECGFIKIIPKHIIRYHTLVRSRNIARLKKEGLLKENFKLEEVLLDYFQEWPASSKSLLKFPDSTTSILTVRMSVLERYLKWRLLVTSEEFKKFCRNYLPLRHKPMSDIQEALNIAQNDLKFDNDVIKRNGFIISSDPINTMLILENVKSLAGLDIREVVRIEPAILKNNYNGLLQIRDLLEEYRISAEAQRRYLKVYNMCPKTVKNRLEELRNLKEYRLLSTHPRVLTMVVHKNKMMSRLEKIYAAKKQCYSLNHLVSSSNVFNNYINSFGDKVCGGDIATLITSSLHVNIFKNKLPSQRVVKCESDVKKTALSQLRRHKFWLHAALGVIYENIQFLKERFDHNIIVENCQILLYPVTEVERHVDVLLKLRNGKRSAVNEPLDIHYNNLNYATLTDEQILSLVLYEIEKKFHFSGDGIWARQDGVQIDAKIVH